MPLLDFGVETPSADQGTYGVDQPLTPQIQSIDSLSDIAIQRAGDQFNQQSRQQLDQQQARQGRQAPGSVASVTQPMSPEQYKASTTLTPFQPLQYSFLEKMAAMQGGYQVGAAIRARHIQQQLGPIATDYRIKLNAALHNGDYQGAQSLMAQFGQYSQLTPEAYKLWDDTARMYNESYNRYQANSTIRDSILPELRPDSAEARIFSKFTPKDMQNMQPTEMLKFAEQLGVKGETIAGIRTTYEQTTGKVLGQEAVPQGQDAKDIPPQIHEALRAYNATPGVQQIAPNEYANIASKATTGDRTSQLALDLINKQLNTTAHSLDVATRVPAQLAIDTQMQGGQRPFAAGFTPQAQNGPQQQQQPQQQQRPGMPSGSLGTPEAIQKAMQTALANQETRGQADPYKAVNKDSGALGKYGTMPIHLPLIGLPNTPEGRQTFLNNPGLQENLYQGMVQGLAAKHQGNLDKVFAEWYGGPGGAAVVGTPAGDKPQVNNGQEYPSVNSYAAQTKDRFYKALQGQGTQQQPQEQAAQPENSFPQLFQQQVAGKAAQARAVEEAQVGGRQATELVSLHNQFVPTIDAEGTVKMLNMPPAEAQARGISPLSAPSPEFHAVTTYMKLNGAIKDLQAELGKLPPGADSIAGGSIGDTVMNLVHHAVANGVKAGPITAAIPSAAANFSEAFQRIQAKADTVVGIMNREMGSEGNERSAGMINGALSSPFSAGNAAEAVRSSLEASAREIIKGVGGETAPSRTSGQVNRPEAQPLKAGPGPQSQAPQGQVFRAPPGQAPKPKYNFGKTIRIE